VRTVLFIALLLTLAACRQPTTNPLEVAAPPTTIIAATTSTVPTWSAVHPFPERESANAPSHRQVGDRHEFWLRFADGTPMILGLDAYWGDPSGLAAYPHVAVQRPNGTRFGGQLQEGGTISRGLCLSQCRELDQEPRPDGGRNIRNELPSPAGRPPTEIVVIEYDRWAMVAESYESARSFSLSMADGFPVAHVRAAGYRLGAPTMFLCVQNCQSRIMVEWVGADACATRVATEPNGDQSVAIVCIDDWHVYLDATRDRVNEVRAALTLRQPTAADGSPSGG
jgi:hypothetical protein